MVQKEYVTKTTEAFREFIKRKGDEVRGKDVIWDNAYSIPSGVCALACISVTNDNPFFKGRESYPVDENFKLVFIGRITQIKLEQILKQII